MVDEQEFLKSNSTMVKKRKRKKKRLVFGNKVGLILYNMGVILNDYE